MSLASVTRSRGTVADSKVIPSLQNSAERAPRLQTMSTSHNRACDQRLHEVTRVQPVMQWHFACQRMRRELFVARYARDDEDSNSGEVFLAKVIADSLAHMRAWHLCCELHCTRNFVIQPCKWQVHLRWFCG